MRINKFISDSGLCSRREADRFIERGVVTINGKKASMGSEVRSGDEVRVNGRPLENVAGKSAVILVFNKPTGIVSTTDSSERDNIVDYVNYSERVFPVGRLDKDSQGLILMTNQGDLVNKILRAGNNHEKEYVVTVDKPITEGFLNGMRSGVPILGQVTKRCKVEQESPFVFRITLVQGLNRQIRRMCDYFQYRVQKLERVRIMHIGLKGLPPGEFRDLTEEELTELYKKLEDSQSEGKTKKVPKQTPKAAPKPIIKSNLGPDGRPVLYKPANADFVPKLKPKKSKPDPRSKR